MYSEICKTAKYAVPCVDDDFGISIHIGDFIAAAVVICERFVCTTSVN